MLQDLSTYGCSSDEHVNIGKKCTVAMKKVYEWENKTETIYDEHKDALNNCVDEIADLCIKVAETQRVRLARYGKPLIFQNLEGFKS